MILEAATRRPAILAWLLTAFITAFYMSRWRPRFSEPRARSYPEAKESPMVMVVPLIILAIFSVIGGWVGIRCAQRRGRDSRIRRTWLAVPALSVWFAGVSPLASAHLAVFRPAEVAMAATRFSMRFMGDRGRGKRAHRPPLIGLIILSYHSSLFAARGLLGRGRNVCRFSKGARHRDMHCCLRRARPVAAVGGIGMRHREEHFAIAADRRCATYRGHRIAIPVPSRLVALARRR